MKNHNLWYGIYEDGAELPAQITSAFAKNEAFHGVKITAVSLEDKPKPGR
jgi:hypothetical protein